VKVTADVATAERARRYAAHRGTSISRLVSEFLAQLPLENESAMSLVVISDQTDTPEN
jgi:hypothetical protein